MAKTTAATAPATMAMGKSSSGTEKIKNEIRLSAKHLIGWWAKWMFYLMEMRDVWQTYFCIYLLIFKSVSKILLDGVLEL